MRRHRSYRYLAAIVLIVPLFYVAFTRNASNAGQQPDANEPSTLMSTTTTKGPMLLRAMYTQDTSVARAPVPTIVARPPASIGLALRKFQAMHLADLARPLIQLEEAPMIAGEDVAVQLTRGQQPGILQIFAQFRQLAADGNLSASEFAGAQHQLVVQLIETFMHLPGLKEHEARCAVKVKQTDDALRDRNILQHNRYKTSLIGSRVFICFNLFNSQTVLRDTLYQLLRLVAAIGPRNVFVSIYENGSKDDTKTYLHELDLLLSFFAVPRRILAEFSPSLQSTQNRIEYLASVRNRALEPLLAAPAHAYDKILFVNDVYFCDFDMLELLVQSFRNNADIACGFDYVDGAYWKHPDKLAFYDSWVFRDIRGRPTDTQFPLRMHDAASQARFDQGLPFRVLCCWNGAAVLNPDPFVSSNIVFRRGAKKPQKECAASECSLLCKDFLRLGFDRIIAVPAVGVTYDSNQHSMLIDDSLRTLGAHLNAYLDDDNARVRFHPLPGTGQVMCHPLVEDLSDIITDETVVFGPSVHNNTVY